MLKEINDFSVYELISQAMPKNILGQEDLELPKTIYEYDRILLSKYLASKNKVFSSFIGFGYFGTILPAPIQRNIFENSSWYTAYTPYQAEVSQGRLEALLNFQTLISDLIGFSISNASFLDEGTATAKVIHMLYKSKPKDQIQSNKFFIF
ncbi:hypothetical protein C4S76_11185 [Apibacter adventoris]|nr:hypothetical protein C4S76_11185 [Apibacter adventoris]